MIRVNHFLRHLLDCNSGGNLFYLRIFTHLLYIISLIGNEFSFTKFLRHRVTIRKLLNKMSKALRIWLLPIERTMLKLFWSTLYD